MWLLAAGQAWAAGTEVVVASLPGMAANTVMSLACLSVCMKFKFILVQTVVKLDPLKGGQGALH